MYVSLDNDECVFLENGYPKKPIKDLKTLKKPSRKP